MAVLHALRRTSLLVRFAVFSAVLVAALGLLLSTVFASLTRRTTVDALTKSISTDVTALTDLALSQTSGEIGQVNASQAKLARDIFDAFYQRQAFVGYEVYLSDGTVVASEDASLVGKRAALTPAIRGALAGELSSTLDGSCSGAHAALLCRKHGKLLEFYMPLQSNSMPAVRVAIRGWLPFASTQATISRDVHRIWLMLGVALLVLYVGLFRLMAKASRGLRQDAALHRKRAAQDVLTGVHNRSVLPDRVAGALGAAARSDGRTALVLIDLDRFKQVNDRLGHHVGDLVLQHTARQLQSVVRPGDTVARLGGDEFVVVLREVTSAHAAIEVADRMLSAVAEPLDAEGTTVITHASAGVALGPDDGDTFLDLLRSADTAMYRAKADRGGVRLYSEDVSQLSVSAS